MLKKIKCIKCKKEILCQRCSKLYCSECSIISNKFRVKIKSIYNNRKNPVCMYQKGSLCCMRKKRFKNNRTDSKRCIYIKHKLKCPNIKLKYPLPKYVKK